MDIIEKAGKLPVPGSIRNALDPAHEWKLPILWYIADSEDNTLRYRELERKVAGITATMLTKCLRELEKDRPDHSEESNEERAL